MRQNKFYFLAVMLATLTIFSVVVTLPTLKEAGQPTARLVPQMFPLFIAKQDGANLTVPAQATGVLVDRDRGYVALTKHTRTSLEKHEGYGLYAKIDGKLYPLEVVWKHKTADISVARFSRDTRPAMLPREFQVKKDLPLVGSSVRTLGYLSKTERSRIYACEELSHEFYCEKGLSLTVLLVDAPMSAISPNDDTAQRGVLFEISEKYPDLHLTYEDIFYDRHIVALLPSSKKNKEYNGMSGGALVDDKGRLLGILVKGGLNRLIFVPSREIPDEYLPPSEGVFLRLAKSGRKCPHFLNVRAMTK
ncbi:MAG: hypothetical protein AAB869_02070 [Patescibacteria group bacterium]